ncbi:MAG TPA: copper homeostasis protein CutC [Candidatus Dormibacteraeota bacterium]|nr:copper homeostasis protein CutC [Candidatus Dormibacteraeota bacterium]
MTPGNSQQVLIEVCVDSVASALAAERGGAGRIELCSSLGEGGVTPSAGLIELTRASILLPLHVMIRPRAGDFCYDGQEFETMRRDIALAQRMGANGVVIGILDIQGAVDIDRTRELVEFAHPLSVTFHRAFDMTADLFRALDDVCTARVDRVLTSGGEPTSLQGCSAIAQLVQKAQDRIVIMPGSGIKPDNASGLVRETGVKEIHVGLRSSVPSPMLYRNARVSMGSVAGHEYERFVVLEEDVRRLRAALDGGR